MQSAPTGARGGWPDFLAALSSRSMGTATALAVIAALLLYPLFLPPFVVVLGRTVFVAISMLLAYAAARAWPQLRVLRWLPREVAPLAAMAAAAPPATAIAYVFTAGVDIGSLFGVPERITGFALIAGSAIVLGVLTTLGARIRERLAQARAEALAFELERSRLEKQALDARHALLQAQIEPHFLFNTLANVQALVESQSPRAPEVLRNLIAYLRAAMPRLHEGQPTVADELRLVRAYLALMQTRMPDRLSWSVDVDEGMLGLALPPLLLLTLVENAVRHGIDPGEAGGHIEVGGRSDATMVRLWVTDSGVGMAEDAQPGTGLNNLRARLSAAFGPSAALELSVAAPHGLRAEIRWPR